jgi:hypothetical protein
MNRISVRAIHHTLREWVGTELAEAAGKNQIISKKEEAGLSGIARQAVIHARQ